MKECPKCGNTHIDSCIRFDDVGCRFYYLQCSRCKWFNVVW